MAGDNVGVNIFLGGTANSFDGELEHPGDGRGLELTEIDDIATFSLRAEPGMQTAESLTIFAPLDCHVSADGVAFGETATYPAGSIADINKLCYVKRVSATSPDYTLTELTTDPPCEFVSLVAGTDATPPVMIGKLRATGQASAIELRWDEAADNVAVTGYDIEYGLTTSYGSSTSSEGTVKLITGLDVGVLYYARVRAYDAAGNKSAWITGMATPRFGDAWVDNFSSLDPNKWQVVTGTSSGGGQAIVDNGWLILDGSLRYSASDYALAFCRDEVAREEKTWTVRAGNVFFDEDDGIVFAIVQHPSVPDSYKQERIYVHNNAGRPFIRYQPESGFAPVWTGTTWGGRGPSAPSSPFYTIEFTTTDERWRITLKDQAGNTLTTTDWVRWSAVFANDDPLWLMLGDDPYLISNINVDYVAKA